MTFTTSDISKPLRLPQQAPYLHLASLARHPRSPLLRAINISLNWTIKESNLCVFKTDTGNPVSETLNLMSLGRNASREYQRRQKGPKKSTWLARLVNEYLNICLIVLRPIKRRHAWLDEWVSSDVCHRYFLWRNFQRRIYDFLRNNSDERRWRQRSRITQQHKRK